MNHELRGTFLGGAVISVANVCARTFGPSLQASCGDPEAAYGLGPAVFTLRAQTMSTERASVSQAIASRGAPPLPAMALEACRCCRRTK